MDLDDERGAPVQRRGTEYTPPKSIRSWLIGRPLQTADAPNQTIGKLIGLAIFASDALSSTAYATQEMLVILVLAGAGAIAVSFPLSIAIVVLLTVLTFSYEQTLHAYPTGGGAYIVARDNLGDIPALIAAAALLTDYILTVAVSVSSGVAQITSAFPETFDYRVWISVALVMFVMVINLRGVKESGITFAIPSYFFVVMMYLTVGVGFFRLITGGLGQVSDPPELQLIGELQPLTVFLILRAFANGTTALTGVEAISNGIMAFKEPRSRNAGITLIFMSAILGSLLVGITFLSQYIHAVPSETETVISELARTIYGGRDIFYLMLISGTTLILVLAANTAFAGFPRLSAIAAADGYLPRQLTYRGSRLVYSRGIIALAMIASGLIILFQASVTRLIPLYAIGVFMSFTLSQAGMSYRWWKSGRIKPGEELKERGSNLHYEKNWVFKMVVNGIGAVMTLVVTFVFGITKFSDGAWIIILVIPTLVVIFWSIHIHYRNLAKRLSLEHYGAPPRTSRHRVILALGGVHRGTLEALRYSRMLSNDITAVHVSIEPEETEKLRKKWETWGDGYRLVILASPYRLFIEPLLEYIEQIDDQRQPNEVITVVVPQFIPKHIWTEALHARTADTMRHALLNRSGIVITEVPYQVD
jgi:amino acid transporter